MQKDKHIVMESRERATVGLMTFGKSVTLAEISSRKAEQMKAVEEIRQRFSTAEYVTTR